MNPVNKRPQAVIFDCDGVIVDTEPIQNAFIRQSLAEHGLALSPAEMAADFIGGTMHTVADKAREMGADLPEGWAEEENDAMYDVLAEGVPLIDGVQAIFDRLDTLHIPYAVGSNGSLRKMNVTLPQYPAIWDRVQDKLFSGQDLGHPKPDPTLYVTAARALGFPPRDCVVIDDSPTGCTAGVASGARTLGFARTGNDAALAETGAEVFHAMTELPELLGLIESGEDETTSLRRAAGY